MNILWITNITFPEADDLLRGGKSSLNSSGGWLLGAAEALIDHFPSKLYVASVSPNVKHLTRLEGSKITYFLLPYGKGNLRVNHDYENLWKEVKETVKPVVVHIHGTEFSHGLAYIEACGPDNVCVSIQGLTSVYSRYYTAGLPNNIIRSSYTIHSLLRGGIFYGAEQFKVRGRYEKEILRRVRHIIGRTSWDKSHSWAINPDATYYYCGEILRKVFYNDNKWCYDNCDPHSIFISQAYYPIKGLHILLEAMPYILERYPDVKLRVAGTDIAHTKGRFGMVKLSNYGSIIRKVIKKYHLEKSIAFTGALDDEGMLHEYLRSNVFVCPSSIENSPNSLGEAQILGVPCLSSYVGGVMDMMKGNEENMYRFEEVEMLAYKICSIFEEKEKIDTSLMQSVAKKRHDPITVINQLYDIYKSISCN